MASTSETVRETASSDHDEIRRLRDQVDSLMRERVTPVISDAAGRAQEAARRAQEAARHAGEVAQGQAEALQSHVREAPLTSILIAAAVGYLLGRLTR
jgi:ElaB/YqjD/DUF883 family membrane-anchored ribosome-binding protein